MFSKIRGVFTANRMAALITFVGAAAAFVASIQTSLVPGSPAEESLGKAAIAIAALYKGVTLVEKFLEGSQNFDSLILSGAPKVPGVVVPAPNPAATDNVTIVNTSDTPLTDDEIRAAAEEAASQMSSTAPSATAKLAGFGGPDPDTQTGADPGNPPTRPA